MVLASFWGCSIVNLFHQTGGKKVNKSDMIKAVEQLTTQTPSTLMLAIFSMLYDELKRTLEVELLRFEKRFSEMIQGVENREKTVRDEIWKARMQMTERISRLIDGSVPPVLDFKLKDLHILYGVNFYSRVHLRRAGIIYVGDLVRLTEDEALSLKGFGPKSLNETREILKDLGLQFGMSFPNWSPPEG